MNGMDDACLALLELLPRTGRGPKREGIFALWLVVRVAQDLVETPPADRPHRKRLAALEQRLSSLTVPPPLRRALAGALAQLREGPAAAAQVLAQLAAPAREAAGPDAASAVESAARAARLALASGARQAV